MKSFLKAIELERVSFSYAGSSQKVLDNVSFTVNEKDFVGVIGRTGCGKTTLLLVFNGIVPKLLKGVFSGSVRVFGEDISRVTVSKMSARIAFVFQDPNDQIFCATVEEEVGFALKMQKLDARATAKRVSSALSAVGLRGFEERDPTTLSQGQKQKLALATAIAMGAPIIVCDEPAASLDYESALHIYGILRKLNHGGKTIVVAEHDPEFLDAHANKIVALDGGRIVYEGSKKILRTLLMKKLRLKQLK